MIQNTVDPISKKEVLKLIVNERIERQLGLFIGAGFSMALLNKPYEAVALSWPRLLSLAADRLNVGDEFDFNQHVSLPDLSSKLCFALSNAKNKAYDECVNDLKVAISNICCWLPDLETRKKYEQLLSTVNPAWIITTNYDLVIESLLPGKSKSLAPEDLFVAPQGFIPIYHLHGLRTIPSSIVVTQEDYLSLLRPNEYRYTKLPLLFKESLILMLGYGLGDFNVLMALDWSKNVYTSTNNTGSSHNVIQVVYNPNEPANDCQIDRNGVIIWETDSIEAFLIDLSKEFNIREKEILRLKEELALINDLLIASSPETIKSFCNEKGYREVIIGYVNSYNEYLIIPFIEFLEKCLNNEWLNTSRAGNYGAYDNILNIVMDVLYLFDNLEPAITYLTVKNLDSVLGYVSDKKIIGKSWQTKKIWDERKFELDQKQEFLFSFARTYHFYYLIQRLY